MPFPVARPRRLRQTKAIRALSRETRSSRAISIYPIFFSAALREPRPVATMPGVSQLPVSAAAAEARAASELGLGGVLLFGLPKNKDADGTGAYDPDGPVPRAIAAMKDAVPDLLVITDVCVDEYTDHGHCGILTARRRTARSRSTTTRRSRCSRKAAVVHANAGADIVAPSDMMDGRVGAIRKRARRRGLRRDAPSSPTR